MQAACEEFGIRFEMEEAPDPITEAGVPGAQAYIREHVPEWLQKYGDRSAYFCTNDAHTAPLISKLLDNGGYFIEADLPSPLLGYPEALRIYCLRRTCRACKECDPRRKQPYRCR